MCDLAIAAVLTATGGKLVDPVLLQNSFQINGVVTDNRQIQGGELFVAIQGARTDGNCFAKAALAAGACAVLSDAPENAIAAGADPTRLIWVKDVVEALGKLAQYWLAYLRDNSRAALQVIGITGSVGKTSTKDLLATLLAHRGAVVAPPNSFNNEIGLALTVLRADLDTASLILEMGADRIGNIAYLTQIAPLDLSVVLAVAKAHLGSFGSLENTIYEKSQIINGTLSHGVVLLNLNDENVAKMAEKAQGRVEFFGSFTQTAPPATNLPLVWADQIAEQHGQAEFNLHLGTNQARIRLGLLGMHHINNALAAAGIAYLSGVSFADICTELESARPRSPHRMDVRKIGQMLVIDDAYNANPSSMRAGIAALGSLGQNYQRRVAVLGQMLELGVQSAKEHRNLLAPLLAAHVQDLILVGQEAFVLTQGARQAGMNVVEYEEVDALLLELDTVLAPDCALLLKGSNSTRVWQVANHLFTEGLTK